MQDAKIKKDEAYCEFIELFKLSALEQALSPFKGSQEHDAVLRYYFACIAKLELHRLQEPLALLRQTLEPMRQTGAGKGPADGLTPICEKIADYETRVQRSLEQLRTPATEVPKIMHFVWLGGGVGEIQRDYLNLWKRVMAGTGHVLNLWYDSDALLAHHTNKLIVEAAKADALAQVDGRSVTADELATLYEARAIVLKQQMQAHIEAAVAAGRSADDARIDLLVRAYGQDADALRERITQNLLSVAAFGDDVLTLRDLGDLEAPMALQHLYEREIRLRGNLAAASDIVRLHALVSEGGSYADVDGLPPLAERLGAVDITGWGADARLGALQLLLDRNPDWMPGRQAVRGRYISYFERIPEQSRAALDAFASSHPSLGDVFRRPAERSARPFELRAVAESNSLSNAFLMAHPGAGMIEAVLERMRLSYAVVDGAAKLARERGVAFSDNESMVSLAHETVEQALGPLPELPMEEEIFAGLLADAAAGYFRDGIRPQSEGTIYLTGPAAMRDGMRNYQKRHFTPQGAAALGNDLVIVPSATVNRMTEEEQDHSWKDNGTDSLKWVSDEQAHWRDGRYAIRYGGDIAQLLKHSTVEFQSGWPVIEGRAVLLSGVLQRLVDALGEPLVQAMRSGLDGEVRFDKPLPLRFEDRQAIKAQPLDVLPPAFAGETGTAGAGVDEVLGMLAKGTLHVVQADPVQRLALGALLGADSLDNRRLVQLHSELDNLANSIGERGSSNRYAALERHLFKRRPPGFLEGLASVADEPVLSSGRALDLMKSVMLNAHTPFQWGRHVAQIRQLATLEHRIQVQERVEQVLQRFDAASVKLVPQDLLLQGSGDDLAGRCYPLSLVMGAALAQGEQASRRLRERFYLAVLEPEQSDSIAFLNGLETLRDVPLSEVGRPAARTDLSGIRTRLEASGDRLGLMLISDNHVLLVAKTAADAGGATLHFFDPNFGLFGFKEPAAFQQALEDFFVGAGMAGHYAAFGEPGRPMFDVIELQGERVSALPLSAGLRLAHLLESDTLPGQPSALPIRRRVASARGRSLSDNAHLGRSLLDLDSRWWARQIADATVGLQALHASPRPWVPLFETLEVTPDSAYRITLVDPLDATHVVQVASKDHRLLRIRQWLTERFSTLVRKPQGAALPSGSVEAGAVHTLNAGFALQSLMMALREREGDDRTLTLAVRLHGYVNYAQLAHGLAVDAAGLMRLYATAINQEPVIARTCAPLVGEALGHVADEGVGSLLGLANVGFDIYQLATAKREVDVARFGTQLAFDSAGLVAGLGGLAAAATGAGTAAAVLGGAGVILGGLAIGAAALAQGFAIIAEEAKTVGLFFDHLEKAWNGAVYRFDEALQAWVVDPSSLIIECVDLGTGTLTLGSPKLFRLRDHFGVPGINPDDKEAFGIRQTWGISSRIKAPLPAGQCVVLPCTPNTNYSYEYQALPFASWRHDAGFDAARRLERKDGSGQWKFLFSFYSFPSHYIVHRLFPNYLPTTVEVRLDAAERQLAVPIVPPAWHGLLTYALKGAGGTCTLLLNPGVSVELHSTRFTHCRWVLRADWASEQAIKKVEGGLLIDGIRVKFIGKGRHDVALALADRRVFSVDLVSAKLDLLQDTAPDGLDETALLERYKTLAHDHRLVLPYTPVDNYLIPFEPPQTPRHTKAWYDAHEDRFLYMRDLAISGSDKTQLALVSGGSAYFYEPSSFLVWQVDAVSGLPQAEYRLLLMPGESSIQRIEADARGMIHVVQMSVDRGRVKELGYLIHDRQLLLCSVTCGSTPKLRAQAFAGERLARWASVLGEHWPQAGSSAKESDTTIGWAPAPYVSVCWQMDEARRDLVWIRGRDRLLINPLPAPGQPRGWDDSTRNLDRLTLLVPANDEEVYVVYDRSAQRLCRLQRMPGEGRWSHAWIEPDRLKQVVTTPGGYVAITEDGHFFNLNTDGRLQFGGLTEHWLQGRSRWWETLKAVAQRYPVDRFALIGLLEHGGHGHLGAWYIDQRLLLCASANGDRVRLLGLAPDRRQAWLFDPSGGRILSQAFVDPGLLEQAFANGAQLLRSGLLPAPQEEWDDWRFSDVRREGAGLRGTTVDGVELVLRFGETERVTGVNHAWVTAQGDHLIPNLQALLRSVEHDGFVSTEAEPGVRQWYDVENACLVRVVGTALRDGDELLGTRRREQVLLHDRQDRCVLVYPDAKRLGPFTHVQRDAEVMVVEGQNRVTDLPALVPDGVGTVVLRAGQGAVTYFLPTALWLERDSVIVDCRPVPADAVTVPAKLVWLLDDPQRLQLQIVDGHLVLIDPDSEHCLILRDVCSDDPLLRGEVFLAFGAYPTMSASRLVQLMRTAQGAPGGAALGTLLAPSRSRLASAGPE
ncbi:TcdA/TcdB pore-forming domain-containing protein [Pseudomonas sp. B2(2017)]|uniref:TcdA/TcdB pore-forming domain-containing protein n=1 Tax=Pseudomonas sp. B2(2017) TaxID=1981728 RepID=UPI000A1F8DB5|nr:TcdA/TcdB pore-forming domain-containing protein [Pseudomonas sp. B2(2017)]